MPPPAPTADAVLAGLDPEQREVALAPFGPVVVRAGAGTGKTRAITHRIAYGAHAGLIDPAQVLAVTFTTRAAGELVSRLRGLGVPGVQARTFHSAALRQLRHFWPRSVGGAMPEVASSKSRLVALAASRLGLATSPTLVRDLASEIEWAKASQVVADTYVAAAAAARRDPPVAPEEIARLLTSYEDVKTERHQVDFEDILLLTVALLEEDDAVAREVRDRYRHLVVDEYQDVNPLQERLLRAWLGERRSVTVVGDAAQTIYTFAGASADHLRGFAQRFPDAVQVQLVRNYRSTPQIVATANAVLAAMDERAVPRLVLQSQGEPGPRPRLHAHADEVEEAAGVAQRIAAQHAAGSPLSTIAVLFRVNAQSEAYEAALADAGIPYVLRGGDRFFERPEVRQAVTLLRGTARAGIEPPVGSTLADQVRDALGAMGWTTEPPTGAGATRAQWESLQALVALADDLAATTADATLSALVADLDARAAAQHAPTVEGVTLASLHAAKGLEWDHVHLVGLVDGTVPLVHAATPAALEEERRLFYVGVTRARRTLDLGWAAARAPGGRAARRPSRFLDDLAAVIDGASARGTAARRPRERTGSRTPAAPVRCRVCGRSITAAAERKLGRCLACEVDVDPALVERLRAWRLAESRRASVPAFVVFTDVTLLAIAEAAPSSDEALLAVPGVGSTKLQRYGPALRVLLAGGDPEQALAAGGGS